MKGPDAVASGAGRGSAVQYSERKTRMADTEGKRKSWRDVLKIHPAAEMFPLMSKDELEALGEDIKKGELRESVSIFYETPEGEQRDSRFARAQLMDGRNRLDACELAGIRCRTEIPQRLDILH
jgi:hypothetical protein